jgi:hypothetical protein
MVPRGRGLEKNQLTILGPLFFFLRHPGHTAAQPIRRRPVVCQRELPGVPDIANPPLTVGLYRHHHPQPHPHNDRRFTFPSFDHHGGYGGGDPHPTHHQYQ